MNLLEAGTLNAHSDLSLPEGTILGIRPEDLTLDAAGPLFAQVIGVEYLGADRLIACRIGDETLIVRGPARDELTRNLTADDSITLALEPTAKHLFDKASGKRLTQNNHFQTLSNRRIP